jgi:general secretion pathway protein D
MNPGFSDRTPGVLAVVLIGATLMLAACNVVTTSTEDNGQIDIVDKVRSIDLLPRYPKQVGTDVQPTGRKARAAVYAGTDDTALNETAGTSATARAQSSGDGFELNFENTPITTVAKVVFGDILGSGYTIDPRVQGSINLSSVRPVAKADILFVLEGALRLAGVVMVRDQAGYRLIPLSDAPGTGGVEAAGSTEAGYGITVVPLQYVSAQTLMKLLENFALKPGTVRAEARRNMLLVQGSGAERRAAVEAAVSFDADWMRGQSVGVFPLTNGSPEPIVAELEKIMDTGENGLGRDMVKFQSISRMNAILVVAAKANMLKTAETWIRRLDTANGAKNAVHVYHVKFGEARQLARVLNDMFNGGSSASSLDSQSSQLAPGSGATTSSSGGDRLSVGNFSSTGASGTTSGGGSSGGRNLPSALSSGPTTPALGGAAAAATAANLGGLGSAGGSQQGNKPLLEGVRITPDVVNNTLLIYADQESFRIIEGTLRQIDRQQLQVAIDATVAEVTLNDTLAYGVQTYLTSKNLGLGDGKGSILNTTATTATNALINRALPGFNFLVGGENSPSIILDALHNLTQVKILSNPSLVVIDNQVASLQVGDQVPISTGNATLTNSNAIVNTFDYRDTGIILRVSPRVNVNGNVRLDIEQEISSVTDSTAKSATPTVSQRKVKSSISVASGQTVLLAGLVSENQQRDRSGIPLLDEIPTLGDAFGHTNRKGTRTELIIFIRPQIIRDGSDAQFVAEEIRSKIRGSVRTTAETNPRGQRVR